ncbi:reverse transcriptase [Senna tora]|uniref:Reverse transcriptase n=1 Tax=Senna tora TaxID=362788 RepID=A0A834VY46_9FABA|nr:reverse transcriptase [Senna tora]
MEFARASREVLPVRSSLLRRGVDVVDECPLGCSEEESVLHALVGCPDLHLFWRKTAIPLTDQFECKLPFIEWLNCALPTWDTKNLIWVNSQSFVKDIFQIHTSEGCSVAHHALTLRWERSTPPFYKINVDASVKQGPDGGIGCVARDGSGRVLAALAKRVPSAVDVDILEATAIFTGMEFARDLSIQDIVVEGDSAIVLGYLSSAVSLRSPLGLILDNIRSLCASFRRVEFKWVRREANGVADLLASLGLNVESTYVWLEDRPCVLACALQLDGC